MFVERLEKLASRIGDTLAVALVAADGMPVESHAPDATLDIEVLAAELMTQVRDISQNHQELNVGPVRFFSVSTDRLSLMTRSVTDEYFLLLALKPEAQLGRARYELRRARLEFEKDL